MPHNPQMSSKEIFESELRPCMDRIYGRALSLVNDPALAEDLLQETFLKAWRSIDSYEAGSHPSAWLNRVLYRVFVDQHRRKQSKAAEISIEDLSSDLEGPAAPNPFPKIEQALESWGGDEVVEALKALPENNRIIAIMVDVDSFTYEEVSELLDIPIGTVRSRLFRARQTLFKKLYDYARKNGHVSETIWKCSHDE